MCLDERSLPQPPSGFVIQALRKQTARIIIGAVCKPKKGLASDLQSDLFAPPTTAAFRLKNVFRSVDCLVDPCR
jgi:hypothetical protein